MQGARSWRLRPLQGTVRQHAWASLETVLLPQLLSERSDDEEMGGLFATSGQTSTVLDIRSRPIAWGRGFSPHWKHGGSGTAHATHPHEATERSVWVEILYRATVAKGSAGWDRDLSAGRESVGRYERDCAVEVTMSSR